MEKCHQANLMLAKLQSHICHLWHFLPGAGCLSKGLVQVLSRWGDVGVKKTSFFITYFRKWEKKIRKSTTVQSWLITRLGSDSESQRRVNFIATYTQHKHNLPENHQLSEASVSAWIPKACRLKTWTCRATQPLLPLHCCSGPQAISDGQIPWTGGSFGLTVSNMLHMEVRVRTLHVQTVRTIVLCKTEMAAKLI